MSVAANKEDAQIQPAVGSDVIDLERDQWVELPCNVDPLPPALETGLGVLARYYRESNQ